MTFLRRVEYYCESCYDLFSEASQCFFSLEPNDTSCLSFTTFKSNANLIAKKHVTVTVKIVDNKLFQ